MLTFGTRVCADKRAQIVQKEWVQDRVFGPAGTNTLNAGDPAIEIVYFKCGGARYRNYFKCGGGARYT